MIKYYLNKFIPNKLGNKIAMLYENWIIPPQNESLIEKKRQEFKERTKYLDPKVLYTLTDEEKSELRLQGYFVDLDKRTLHEIKNFKLTHNRHYGQYRIKEKFYNFGIYQQRYYYTDQNYANFQGDPQFYNKMWRNRTRVKKKIGCLILFYLFLYINYYFGAKRHRRGRKIVKKIEQKKVRE